LHPDRVIATLLGIAFPIFTAWLFFRAAREREPNASPDRTVLRFTRSLRVWWYVCLCLFSLGFGSDIFLGKVKPNEQVAFWFTFLGFAGLLAVGTWFLLAYRVEYDATGVEIHLPMSRIRRIPWEQVSDVQMKKGTGLVLTVRAGKRQVVSSLLPGVEDLLEEARARAARAA